MSGLGLSGSSSLTKQSNVPQPKDQPVCPELLVTVDNFKSFIAEQKKLREELVNLSQQPLMKLKDELSSMMQQISVVTAGLRRLAAQCDRLKEDVRKEEGNVGMVQRNADGGSIVQYENSATIEYFLNKFVEFDTRMRSYKQELEVLEENISSQNRYCLSPKDLVGLLRQMDNEFICLAAQLHTAYEQIKGLKTRYLRSMRSAGGDTRNPFAEVEAACAKLRKLDNTDMAPLSSKRTNVAQTPYGPSPFSITASLVTPSFPISALGGQTGIPTAPGSQTNTFAFQTPGFTGQQPTQLGSLGTSIGLGFGNSPFSQPAATQSNLGLTGTFQFSNPGATVASTGSLPSLGLGLNTSSAQKPLFSFGSTASPASTSANPFGFNTPSSTSAFPSLFTGATTSTGVGTTATSSLFGGGSIGTTAAGDSLFGKRLASKPTSLFLPKT